MIILPMRLDEFLVYDRPSIDDRNWSMMRGLLSEAITIQAGRDRERDKLLSLSICRRKPRTLLRGRFPLNWFNRFEFAEEDFRRCKCVTFFPLHCDDDVKSVTSCRLPTDYLANRSIHLDCQLAMQQHLSLVYDHTHATDSIEFE